MREGNGYVLKGEKIYNSAAHVAHNLVVVAKTKPGRGYDGISMFLVDTSLPGVSIRRLSGSAGTRPRPTTASSTTCFPPTASLARRTAAGRAS